MNASFLKVPVELCGFAITNSFIRPFQVYILLSGKCSGMIKIPAGDRLKLANEIGLKSGRVIKNNLDILIKRNWLGYDKTSGYYFIRSIDEIRKIEKLATRPAAKFYFAEIKDFKGFIAGAFIGYLSIKQKRKAWAAERIKRRSIQTVHALSNFFNVSNLAIAKILNICINKAFRYKQIAEVANYIQVEKTFIKTEFTASLKDLFIKGNPEIENRVKIRNGFIWIQGIDRVKPNLSFTKRKKIET